MLSFTTSYSLECCVKWGKVGKIIIVKNKNVRGAVVSVPKTKALLTPTINPFLPNVPFLNSLKRSENQRLSNFFRGYKRRTLERNGLICYTQSSTRAVLIQTRWHQIFYTNKTILHSVHRGINPPSKNTTLPFLAKPPSPP